MLLNEFLENTARTNPDKVALVCQRKRLTFSEIDNSAGAFGDALIQEGFQKQDRAVVYLDNSVESVLSIFGILKAGGIFVIINPAVKAQKLTYMISNCQANVLITDSNHLKYISDLLSELSSLQFIVVVDHKRNQEISGLVSDIRLYNFQEMLSRKAIHSQAPRCIDIDIAALIYTSGFSGIPKGVMLTHQNMVSAAESIIQYLGNTQEDKIINTLPLSHSYGLFQVLMAFKFGGTVVLEKGFTFPEQIFRIMVKEKVTGWPIVPTIAAILFRQNNLSQHDFSRLRYITSAGQALLTKHISSLRSAFPGVKIYSMYGLTECIRVSYLPPEQIEKKPESVGKAMPNTEIYLVDKHGNVITQPDKVGELVVRGSNVMQGYWSIPEATAKVLHPGRYQGEKVLYSGDLFKKDADGDLYFLGRKDDIIKTSGYMVSPKEVENVLSEIEDVIEAAVIGVEDEIPGQVVKAFVHLTDNSKITEKEIISYCYKRLEDYAVPKYISFCTSLPKTDSGKILKRELY